MLLPDASADGWCQCGRPETPGIIHYWPEERRACRPFPPLDLHGPTSIWRDRESRLFLILAAALFVGGLAAAIGWLQ